MADDKSPSSSDEQMIPKARFNEVNSAKNAYESENAYLKQTLSQMVQSQRAQSRPPAEEDPAMKELRETNPAMYKRELQREASERQLRAGLTGIIDQQDRTMFIQAYGNKGQKRMAEVEQILEQHRANGRFNLSRGEVYVNLLGYERVQKELEESEVSPAPKQAKPQADQFSEEDDAPPSDPRHATSAAGGSAPASSDVKSREERIKELEDIVF